MSFEQLLVKVKQAEDAVEARERNVAADIRQFKSSWRAAWTPGRIVIAGLASGFMVGRAKPLKHATGGGILQLITALSGLFASGHAQAAAEDANDAAQMAEQTAVAANDMPLHDVSQKPDSSVADKAATHRWDGPRRPEPRPLGPTPAEAATELSER